jgi:catechol 2,3-dioxygenase-like lactoylglutathione lyase family enzyme
MPDLPSRLHHSAVVVKDLAESYEFYTDIMGMPLVATWCEQLPDGTPFCHAFFGLQDESTVALFQFASEDLYQQLKRPTDLSAFHHLAVNGTAEYQEAVRQRADAKGLSPRVTNHGYCTSLYVNDPDDHVVEVTVDNDVALENASLIRDRARSELDRWLAGDMTTNNDLRA